MRKGIPWIAVVAVLLPLAASVRSAAEDDAAEAEARKAAHALGSKLEGIIERYYPDGERTGSVFFVHEGRVYAERTARTFLVHHADKVGRWMEAKEERGPLRGGLVLEAHVHPGRYIAARATGPYDVRYYVEHRMVAYDAAKDLHVVCDLRLPPEPFGGGNRRKPSVPRGFLEAVQAEVARFGSPVDGPR